MSHRLYFLAAVFLAPLGFNEASADELFLIDFEQSTDLAAYDGLDMGRVQAQVVSGGRGGQGHCLRLRNPEPATAWPLSL